MENVIVVAVILVIVALAAWYVYKSKKSGKKCIGCPYEGSCSQKEQDSCTCGCDDNS